jgi:hypothetical protein
VYLQEDYYDLVDVDSFGSDTSHLAGAIDALKYGGMLYLTSTDGMSAAGKRPTRALAAYGCYSRCLPSANEQGLRMLIGAAVREGAARGVTLTPLFSLYSYHGPVSSAACLLQKGRIGGEADQSQCVWQGGGRGLRAPAAPPPPWAAHCTAIVHLYSTVLGVLCCRCFG